MRLIYIAGPYTAATQCERLANVQRAREVADQVNRLGGTFAVTPHFLSAGIEDSGDAGFWYEGTLEVMRRCDAVILVPGWEWSLGAVEERDEADRRALPVFKEIEELREWLVGVTGRPSTGSEDHR